MKKTVTAPRRNSIGEIRRGLGLSQRRLAKHLGMPRSTLSMAECGKGNMPTSAFIKIAEMEIARLAQEQQVKAGNMEKHAPVVTENAYTSNNR